jgi:hypothetical protein
MYAPQCLNEVSLRWIRIPENARVCFHWRNLPTCRNDHLDHHWSSLTADTTANADTSTDISGSAVSILPLHTACAGQAARKSAQGMPHYYLCFIRNQGGGVSLRESRPYTSPYSSKNEIGNGEFTKRILAFLWGSFFKKCWKMVYCWVLAGILISLKESLVYLSALFEFWSVKYFEMLTTSNPYDPRFIPQSNLETQSGNFTHSLNFENDILVSIPWGRDSFIRDFKDMDMYIQADMSLQLGESRIGDSPRESIIYTEWLSILNPRFRLMHRMSIPTLLKQIAAASFDNLKREIKAATTGGSKIALAVDAWTARSHKKVSRTCCVLDCWVAAERLPSWAHTLWSSQRRLIDRWIVTLICEADINLMRGESEVTLFANRWPCSLVCEGLTSIRQNI